MPKRAAGSGICQTRRAALRISHAQRAVAASRGTSTGATLLGVTSRGLGEVVGVVVDPHSEQRIWQRVPSSWAVRGVFGLCLAQPRPTFSGSAWVNIRTRARVDIACNVAGGQAPFGGFQCEADGDAMRCTALWTHVGSLAVGSWQRWCCWVLLLRTRCSPQQNVQQTKDGMECVLPAGLRMPAAELQLRLVPP